MLRANEVLHIQCNEVVTLIWGNLQSKKNSVILNFRMHRALRRHSAIVRNIAII